ncbi:M23 family metallopeptidase [Fulvimarina sp. MAC8]|uniref:M23 family metallopeptidase n=1 Tax=Fulvimarina sp. MAC8 TaxID=3162874 RepID=UPI0032ECC41D
MHRLKAMALAALSSACLAWPASAEEGTALGVPLDCKPGETCFLQQYPDMDEGPKVEDPFCGEASYDGHSGTDIRVPSMTDIVRDVPVLALADGTVRAIRDGEEDRPIRDKSEWPRFKGRDCGNGAIIDHANGLETQYCHMRKGSLAVAGGDEVKKGQMIGAVGSSGMAAFPHLHLTVRRDGKDVDPFTGKLIGSGCSHEAAEPLWSQAALDFLDKANVHVMGLGMTGSPPKYESLMLKGPPADLTSRDRATVGWGWFLNLSQADRLHFKITAPDGTTYTETETPPLSHRKAAYMQFVGRGRSPEPGEWTLEIDLKRDGKVVETKTRTVSVK